MSKCKQCGNEYEPKRATSQYCGDPCRKLASRQRDKVSVPSGNEQVSVPPYFLIPDTEVYGRRAVRYELREAWNFRPEPLTLTDEPLAENRGRYTRQDGTQYQFDSAGIAFEVTNGLVYQTVADVRACYKETA